MSAELELVERGLEQLRALLVNKDNVRDGLGPPELLAAVLRLPQPPSQPYTVEFALSAVPGDWWFHVSHLTCEVVPTATDPCVPWHNSQFYRENGSPVRFRHTPVGRANVAHALLCARLKAARAQLRTRRAVLLQRHEHVDTGDGPMVACPDGTLREIHYDEFLDRGNKLVRRTEQHANMGSVHPCYFAWRSERCAPDAEEEPT